MLNIRFIALGGQDERGKNIYALEVANDLFILDAGVKFPEKGILGIDVVIPNIDYLRDNAKRIKGVFVTNPASYNAGALSYLLKEFDAKVYGNELTKLVVRIKSQKLRVKHRDEQFVVVKDKDVLDFGEVQVEVFRTTSSSPQSFGYAFHTSIGTVVYAGDYIIDGQEESYFSTDFVHLAKIAERGVLALIADTEYASRLDFTAPNHKIENFITTPFKDRKSRIIVGIFEEDIFKLGEICAAAKDNGRKIAVYGRTMYEIIHSNMISANLKLNSSDLFSLQDYMRSDNGVLIISGTGDVLYSKLAKIATGNDEVVELTSGDVVILATPPAAGVEKRHAEILDELARTDARLIALSDRNIWGMHASFEDIKMLISLLKPTHFIPVKALYKEFLKAAQAAVAAGVAPANIGIVDNGQILTITPKHVALAEERVRTGDVYVDGIGVGDVGSLVLNERKQLANDGCVVVGATIDIRNKELISLIDMQMRGVIYIDEENPIFKILQKQITDILEKGREVFRNNPAQYDISDVKKEIISTVRSSIKQASGKQPMILAIINEVSGKEYVPNMGRTYGEHSEHRKKPNFWKKDDQARPGSSSNNRPGAFNKNNNTNKPKASGQGAHPKRDSNGKPRPHLVKKNVGTNEGGQQE